MKTLNYDAIIVGASISGCICAIELAKKGLKIALIEKRVSLNSYKTLCTHILHPAFIKYLNQLGVLDELLQKSALNTNIKLVYGGMPVFYPLSGKQTAGNIERLDLDPALRRCISAISSIDLLMGEQVNQLRLSRNRVSGVYTNDSECLYLAPLIIGADGRNSQIAKLAGATTKITGNGRIAVFCYFETAKMQCSPNNENNLLSESHVWALDQGKEYISIFPNNHHSLVSWYLPDSEHKRVLQNPEAEIDNIVAYIAKKGITMGKRVSKIIISKDTSPVQHFTNYNNLVLVGDAKLSADPLTGIGCTWAMQSAKLLSFCLGQGAIPNTNKHISRANLYIRLRIYLILHWFKFGLLSRVMSFASMHGRFIFAKPVFRFLAFISK